MTDMQDLYSLDFTGLNIVVLGDLMLDRSIQGIATRISPEAPVPVVRALSEASKLGGAANVAANLTCLGARVDLIGVVGGDVAADSMRKLAEEAKIQPHFVDCAELGTTVKTRIISQGQQLVRVDHEEPEADRCAKIDASRVYDVLHGLLGKADLLLLSDYAKGVLGNPQPFIQLARQLGKPVVIDPKQQDFKRYAGATVITPNYTEFCKAIDFAQLPGRDDDEFAAALIEQCQIESLCLTRGEGGVTVYAAGQPASNFPARAREVYDVTGAGDTFIAVLAASLAFGKRVQQAAELANIAAGLVVAKHGTSTISVSELASAALMQYEGVTLPPVLNQDTLGPWVQKQKSAGRKLVMTNGCFDLLHPGHWDNLLQARQFGDVLLVAVNDDDSVKALKGNLRPINPLADRLRMLQGCRDVSALVSFSQLTPFQLIENVAPDVLVKGGDYREADVAGADVVRKLGGQVQILAVREGYSSTNLIQKISTLQNDALEGGL